MNFSERMRLLRREYRDEASRLDKRLDELGEQTESGFTRVQVQMLALQDQMGGVVESIGQVKADYRETARTLQGRSRLLEDRFGKMLDLVEITVAETPTRTDFDDLKRRVEALEKKDEPAA